jgi:Ni/Fe-hydrogenase subunit HybB-like protein
MTTIPDQINHDLINHDVINHDLLRPVGQASSRFFLVVAMLGLVVLAGFSAWGYQVYSGIGVAGIRRPVFWGFYITNFVFWIGISHAGTLISAILRLANAGWRRPVTRCAEVITVFALCIGAMFPIIHLGRPWVAFWLIPYPNERGLWPNYRSPLLWDFFAINTYLIGSITFLILPIIPDFALCRDKFSGWRKTFYGMLALGWRGTQRQWHRLETAMHIMAIIIIPVAVSVHTIVSWDFAMTPVPMWHSTIFAPYFVVGAIFSGIAALILAMVFLRKLLHLEEYLPSVCFDNLGKLLLLMSLLWVYFVFAERLTIWYGNHPAEVAVLWLTQNGPYRYLFWTMVACNFLIPFPLLAIKKLRTITGTCIASITVVVGMWLERYLIIVPSLSRKFLPYAWGTYRPTWVEITITAATFAAMALLYVVFAKFVPIISIWELKVGMREAFEPTASVVAVSRTRTGVSGRGQHETAAGVSFKNSQVKL